MEQACHFSGERDTRAPHPKKLPLLGKGPHQTQHLHSALILTESGLVCARRILFKKIFMYLFIFGCAGSSLLCRFFSSCSEPGLLFLVVCRLLTLVASLVEHRLSSAWASIVVARGLSSCGFWALEHRLNSHDTGTQLLYSTWDLPGPGVEPVSPPLTGGFFTTGHQQAWCGIFKATLSIAFTTAKKVKVTLESIFQK